MERSASSAPSPFLVACTAMPSMPTIARRPCLSSAVFSLKRASSEVVSANLRGSK
jgi:hypothetical protein